MTESQNEAYEAFNHSASQDNVLECLAMKPMGNQEIGEYTGMQQTAVSGCLGHLRLAGKVRDTGEKTKRANGYNENVWALGDDRLTWLPRRIRSVRTHLDTLEGALLKAQGQA